MSFSRRPGHRFNRGRIATMVSGTPAPPAYDPMTALANGILWSKMDRDVVTSSASLTSADPANAAWTKTNCTVIATGTGTQCQLTAGGATDAYVTITPSNVATGALCVPCVMTIRAKYETIRYLIIESRSATANNRAVFDLQNGVISSPGTGINMQDLAMTLDGDGLYTCSATTWANGGAMIFRAYGSTDTTLTAPAVGTTMLLDSATITQVHAATIANYVSGTNYAASGIDTRPGYNSDTIVPCIRGYGGQIAYSLEAALAARFTHGAAAPFPSYSYAALMSFRDSDNTGGRGVFGYGNTAQAVNMSGYLGGFETGTGSFIVTARNTGADNVESVDTPPTAVGVFGVTYDGTTGTTRIYWDGTEVAAYTAGGQIQNLINLTVDRTCIFGRGATTPTALFFGDLYEHVMYSDAKDAADMLSLATGLLTRVA